MTEDLEVVLPPEPETILDLFKPETRKVDECFDCFTEDPESAVTEIFPKIFADNRGWFTEVTKGNHSFIKQSNMSCSRPGTVRGFHAQKGKFCQGQACFCGKPEAVRRYSRCPPGFRHVRHNQGVPAGSRQAEQAMGPARVPALLCCPDQRAKHGVLQLPLRQRL